jgi:hypothetical protein
LTGACRLKKKGFTRLTPLVYKIILRLVLGTNKLEYWKLEGMFWKVVYLWVRPELVCKDHHTTTNSILKYDPRVKRFSNGKKFGLFAGGWRNKSFKTSAPVGKVIKLTLHLIIDRRKPILIRLEHAE